MKKLRSEYQEYGSDERYRDIEKYDGIIREAFQKKIVHLCTQ